MTCRKRALAFGDHRLAATATIPQPSKYVSYACTRAFLDWHVRQRLQALGNITILQGHDAGELTAAPDRTRVTGVRVTDRSDGSEAVLGADLVVDATGRGSRAPAFLDDLGYGRPVEDEVFIHLTYASMPVHIDPGTVHQNWIVVMPKPGQPKGLVMFECENGTWMVGVCAMFGQAVPRQHDELLEFAERLAPAPALATARKATPLATVSQHRVASNRWRRYDKMRRTPGGFLVLGDAICSFNPVYGQVMTVAAIETLALRDCLTQGEHGLPRRFFRQSAKTIKTAWQTAVGSDLTMREVKGRRPLSIRMTNAWMDRVLTAAEADPEVVQRFLQVIGMTEPPSRLLRPSFAYRVARARRRTPSTG